MSKELATAADAIRDLKFTGDKTPFVFSSPFVCPHSQCGAYAVHTWGVAKSLNGMMMAREPGGPRIVAARCTSCSQETIWVGSQMVWPLQVLAPAPAADMPIEVIGDFEEARRIHALSPRGSAALLRLVVQKLCPILGSDKKDINKAIGDLVAQQKISPMLQKALDAVRVIGNESVHPGELDIKDDHETVASLFALINFIVYEAITRPKEIGAIYAMIPENKLAGIVARDGPSG